MKLFSPRVYGYANVEKRSPIVSPDKTLFRVASLSKASLATAAITGVRQSDWMHLLTDTHRYQLRPYPEPARVAQLMTRRRRYRYAAARTCSSTAAQIDHWSAL